MNMYVLVLHSIIYLFNNTLCCHEYSSAPIACNGSTLLASKRYNEVAYATTHNGQSFKKSLVHNQDKTITEQLEAGIRAIKIPLWYGCNNKGNRIIYACHGMSKSLLFSLSEEKILEQVPVIFRKKVQKIIQQAGPMMKTLRDALRVAYGEQDEQQGILQFPHDMFDSASQKFKSVCAEVRSFLDIHPYEIVTLILEDFTNNVPLVAQDIQESGLLNYVHTQKLNEPWPTLKTLVLSGKRMVIFIRTNDTTQLQNYNWLCPLWDYAWDTRFNFKCIADFKHDQVPNRGKFAYEQKDTMPCNKLFIVYHFVTPLAGGSKNWAIRTNRASILRYRLDKLAKQTNHIPNFVQVDFFEYPHNDFLKVINALNGIV
jgi:hypothetical protein